MVYIFKFISFLLLLFVRGIEVKESNQAVSRLVKPNELKKLFDLNKVFTDNFRVLEANVGAGAKRLYDS